jgi:hypothetical protein
MWTGMHPIVLLGLGFCVVLMPLYVWLVMWLGHLLKDNVFDEDYIERHRVKDGEMNTGNRDEPGTRTARRPAKLWYSPQRRPSGNSL